MKKLALTSLLAIFTFSGAHAANVIDGNPLYMPKAGHFYSVTSLSSHTEGTPYTLGEEFGYGITDRIAVEVATSASENKAFEQVLWNDLSLGATFRALDMGAWKLDLIGGYEAGSNVFTGGGLYVHVKDGKPGGDNLNEWFDKDLTGYKWTAGVRGGYTAGAFTLAGHALYNYYNSESFNWGDKGMHVWELGLDGQYVIDSHWSILAGVEYTGVTNDHAAYDDMEAPEKVKNAGKWTGELGVNYNIDATKFVGLYVNGALNHHEGDNADEWGWNDGFGYGVKFGIDF
ncbi:MAG: hypothetical protein IKN73_02585 [Alphaproteobacteria bacterium]|nr:hypothetical protein [Alphaproteobacteria bacterium]